MSWVSDLVFLLANQKDDDVIINVYKPCST